MSPIEHAVATGEPPADRRPKLRLRTVVLYALWQIVLIALFFLVYFGVRGVTTGAVAQANANARDLVDLERTLGMLREVALQRDIIDTDWLVTLANWVYIWGHLPLLAGTAIWLFHTRGERFIVLRNAIFLSGLVGLLIFWRYPVTPPRLGILDLVDTVTDRSNAYRAVQPPGLTNKYAAFPSLHFGWNLILGMMMWGAVRHAVARVLWAASPVAMAAAVVLTGNHYVIDVIGGGILALAGLVAAVYLHRRPLLAIPRFVPPGAVGRW